MKDFLIAGLQRSGTNYIETLLNKNIDNTKFGWEDWYWKHNINPPSLALFRQHNLRGIILCVKNPFAWVESICFRESSDLYDAYGVYYDMNDKSSLYFENNGMIFNVKALIKLYNEYYNNWVNAPNLNIYTIKYEDILKEPTKVITEFKERYNLQFKNDELDTIVANLPSSNNWDFSLKEFYVNYRLKYLDNKQLDYIAQLLDIELLKKIGY